MLRANHLLKKNIDSMLKARGQSRRELAMWTLRTTHQNRADSWISHIFGAKGYDDREIQIKYLDRIADFFGVSVYQLFQPGISHLTERRKHTDRRAGTDRRISATPRGLPTTEARQVAVSPDDEQILVDLHALSYQDYQRVKGWIAVARLGSGTGRNGSPRAGLSVEAPVPPRATSPRSGREKPPK